MKKDEVAMIGFEIVAYSGDARSKLLMLLKEAKSGNFTNVTEGIASVDELLKKAHESQTQMLAAEAGGEEVDLGFIFVHGQDHLMTTLLLRDIVMDMVELYQRTNE
ncbi:PTS lactose/cellobiose transporter subunit IIA [Enterococcus sp. S86.2]|uniref:PTS lactose/cellobiose transporter subunit IIA n=1 Tax=Enterococcus sp. S86.2 TaxID=3031299 RepID=UPI0026F0A04E|nr:PTS lactose/cellobiose transporter subunit IIA [Enterococcus sp. S86.2]